MLRGTWGRGLLLGAAALVCATCVRDSTAVQGEPGQPASVQIVGGDLQSGPAGMELPNPLVVRVVDSAGVPRAGQLVNFRVTSGGGSVFAGASLTNASGVAQERWTLGTSPSDSQRVEARAVDNVTGEALTLAVFRATVLPGAPAHVSVNAGDGQTAPAGTAVGTPPSVVVRDQFQNLVPGVPVAFAVASGGGNVTGASPTTARDGIATVGSWTLGPTPGTNTLTASVGGLPAITFTATATEVAVASVTVAPARASLPVGGTVQLLATARDGKGKPLSGRSVTWTTSEGTVAAVSGSGLVTGVGPGSATITATHKGSGKSGTAAITVITSVPSPAPFGHVFILVEENRGYADVIGSASMPYLNGLAQQYGLATEYYANTHPSLGNYFMLTTGQIVTNSDTYSRVVSVDNVVRELLAAGKTWKAYVEDLPSVGVVDLNVHAGNYASRHNPLVYLSDVHDNPAQASNVVPFTQFAADLAAGAFPSYSFIVPNMCNDGHDCSRTVADAWLRTNIDPLIRSAQFQQDGLLIITFDEAWSTDTQKGGGHVAWIVVSARAKRGYRSTTLYQHESTLRLTLKALGVRAFPNAAATAPDMDEFFTP